MKHKKNKLAPGHSLSIVSAPVSRVYIYMQSLAEALTQSAGDNNQPYQSCRHLSNNKKPASAVATFQNRTECNVATGICGSSSSSAPTHTHTHTHTWAFREVMVSSSSRWSSAGSRPLILTSQSCRTAVTWWGWGGKRETHLMIDCHLASSRSNDKHNEVNMAAGSKASATQ